MKHPLNEVDGSPTTQGVFAPRQARLILREMIKGEIEGGVLRGSKRRQLLRYGRCLGIPRLEANVIIAEVLHGGGLTAGGSLSAADIRARLHEALRRNRIIQRLVLASAAALIIDVLLIDWLF